MPTDPSVKLSKKISYILRHNPGSIPMDRQGWVEVQTLLLELRIDKRTLDHIVETNNKKRFEYDEAGKKIRARQGHSLDIEHGYEPVTPPEFLYHGTARHLLGVLYKEGIKKMKRHHVHLSPDKETAIKVGQRHGKPVVLKVHAELMHQEGTQFYRTDNNVWLVNYIPPGKFEEI